MRGPNGGYVMAAYFAGAILDPAGWLIPFGKAKNLASTQLYEQALENNLCQIT